LTSPLELKKYETFDEILGNNLTLYSLPLRHELLQAYINDPGGPKKYFADWKRYWEADEVKFGKMYFHRKSKQVYTSLQEMLSRIVKTPMNYLEMKTMIEFSYYVETIAKCGQDAFADTLSFVEKLRSKLNVDKQQISQSKAPYGQMYRLWYFRFLQSAAEDYARRRFGLIESGLVRIWNEWKYYAESWNDTVLAAQQTSLVKPLSMNGNLVVVFYVDVSLKFVCLVMFACECIKYLKKLLSCAAASMFMELKLLGFTFWECMKAMFQRR